MATKIAADGTTTEVKPRRRRFTLEELYEHVGCRVVEAIELYDGRTMWLDEEGKYANPPKPVNREATKLLGLAGGIPGDVVVGDVLVERGETL